MKNIYATPQVINDIKDCYFYHSVDLPVQGTVEGQWDLRQNIVDYLGNVEFKNKRVLDVACKNGALSFHMEGQGAEVVSYDLDKSSDWDLVPFVKWRESERKSYQHDRLRIEKLNRAYWYCHKLLNSNVKVVYGPMYKIPDTIGLFDISIFGSILLHLRDPFLALQNGLRLTKDTVVIAEPLRASTISKSEPCLKFLPNAKNFGPKETWWDIRPEWVVQAIGVLGFEDVKINYHTQRYEDEDVELYTVVGKRTHGWDIPNYTLESTTGAYGTETDTQNTWNWVEDSVEYLFYSMGHTQKSKVKFQFLLNGKPRTLFLEINAVRGKQIASFEIPMNDGWGEYESPVIATDSKDIVIRLKADGAPVNLSSNDSRKTKFLIQNLSVDNA